LEFLTRQAIGGAINGTVFALLIMLLGRKKTLATLGVGRAALCGAVDGIVLPLISLAMLPMVVRESVTLVPLFIGMGVSAALGAAIGSGSLLLARRAPAVGSGAAVPKIDAGAA